MKRKPDEVKTPTSDLLTSLSFGLLYFVSTSIILSVSSNAEKVSKALFDFEILYRSAAFAVPLIVVTSTGLWSHRKHKRVSFWKMPLSGLLASVLIYSIFVFIPSVVQPGPSPEHTAFVFFYFIIYPLIVAGVSFVLAVFLQFVSVKLTFLVTLFVTLLLIIFVFLTESDTVCRSQDPECLAIKAIRSGDYSICKSAKYWAVGSCYSEIAAHEEDISICIDNYSLDNNCYFDYAVAFDDPTYCSKITNGESKILDLQKKANNRRIKCCRQVFDMGDEVGFTQKQMEVCGINYELLNN